MNGANTRIFHISAGVFFGICFDGKWGTGDQFEKGSRNLETSRHDPLYEVFLNKSPILGV